MSYILDALRRAESQRSRGAVPTLHAPMLDAGLLSPTDAHSPDRGLRLGLVLAGFALLIGLAVWAWRAGLPPAEPPRPAASVGGQTDTQPAPSPPAVSAAVTAALPAVTSLPAAPALPSALPAVSNAGSPPVMAAPSVSALEPMQKTPVQAPALRAPPPLARADPGLAPAPVPSSSRQPSVTRQDATAPAPGPETAVAPAARPAESPVLQRRELPAELQRELPALAVSGMVYSADRAQRIVIVNGELLHEGDRMGPELVLEEIRRKDAVLRYKGQRFSISP